MKTKNSRVQDVLIEEKWTSVVRCRDCDYRPQSGLVERARHHAAEAGHVVVCDIFNHEVWGPGDPANPPVPGGQDGPGINT